MVSLGGITQALGAVGAASSGLGALFGGGGGGGGGIGPLEIPTLNAIGRTERKALRNKGLLKLARVERRLQADTLRAQLGGAIAQQTGAQTRLFLLLALGGASLLLLRRT